MKNIRAATKDLEIRKDKAMKGQKLTIYGRRLNPLNGFILLYLP